ncbi:MAG: tetratricopeptide repeat protein [Cytophagales bacterium]|nr:tetratricopeptide repeat protein [Cytophagales bacterium]
MDNLRLEKLLTFYTEDPDAFTIYALAIEYKNMGDARAEYYFDELIAKYPEYVAGYYHAAGWKWQIGKKDEALDIYTKGIEMARIYKDHHALAELTNARKNKELGCDDE